MAIQPPKMSLKAKLRLSERFKISEELFLKVLGSDCGKVIASCDIGSVDSVLIWSPTDDCPIIVSVNRITGVVVTMFSVDRYWPKKPGELYVTGDSDIVINRMVHAGFLPNEKWRLGVTRDYVTVHAIFDTAPRYVGIGRWPFSPKAADLAYLGKDPAFWQWVLYRVETHFGDSKQLISVSAKFKNGDMQYIPCGI